MIFPSFISCFSLLRFHPYFWSHVSIFLANASAVTFGAHSFSLCSITSGARGFSWAASISNTFLRVLGVILFTNRCTFARCPSTAPFLLLHGAHITCVLDKLFAPPSDRARIWSQVNSTSLPPASNACRFRWVYCVCLRNESMEKNAPCKPQ